MPDKKNILITGATGFIGRHLTKFLSKQESLVVWGVSKSGGRVGQINVDCVDLASESELLAWQTTKPVFDAIFHLAAYIPASFQHASADKYLFSNLSITRNVLSLVEAHASLIYVSSGSVYGPGTATPFSDDGIPRPDNVYALSKYVGELLCQAKQTSHQIIACSLRISSPYGPGQRARTVINTFLDAALSAKNLTIYGDGARVQDFVFVDDVIKAMWLAYQKQATGVYNIASGYPVTMRELAETVLELIPETHSRIISLNEPDSQATYRGVYSIEKAKRELDYWASSTLRDGLRTCLPDRTRAKV